MKKLIIIMLCISLISCSKKVWKPKREKLLDNKYEHCPKW